MDAVSYSHSAKQAQRIKKFVAEPDSVAGLVTVPNLVPTGETITIPAGRTVVHPNLQVDGTLDVQGTLFVPAGGSVTQSLVDATVVKQNGSVVANDSTVVHKTGDETIAGVKTFSSNTIFNGNVLFSNGTFGYGTGSGGTATQLTSKSTAVTLNKPCGRITVSNSTLLAGETNVFLVNNSLVTIYDLILVSTQNTNDYIVVLSTVVNGGFYIRITNNTGVTLSNSFYIDFAILKGATA